MASQQLTSNILTCCGSYLFFSTFCSVFNNLTTSSQSYQKLSPKNKLEWRFRNNSTIHAVVVSILCFLVLIIDSSMRMDLVWGYSWKSESILCITLGYLLSDIFYLLSVPPGSVDAYWTTIFHHTLAMFTFGFVVTFGCLSYIAICRLLAEMSTPFINIRWALDVCNKKHTNWYYYNGWMMVFMFFFCRILAMPYGYYIVYGIEDYEGLKRLPIPLSFYCVSAVVVDIMNVYWFSRMIRGVAKYYKLKASRSNSLVTNSSEPYEAS